MKIDLKHCPFCGREAVAFVDKTSNYHGVTCMSCTARIFGYSTHELAADRWNKRVPQTVVNQHGNNNYHIENGGTLNLKL